jgi:hypothetical protein
MESKMMADPLSLCDSLNTATMKNCCLVRNFLLLLLAGGSILLNRANAQKIALNGYSSYVFEGGYNADYGTTDFLQGKTNDGIQWGAGAEYRASDKYGIEAMYLHRYTHARQQSETDPLKQINFNVGLNYLLTGINGYMQPDTKKIQAYGSLFAGIVVEHIDFPNNAINSSLTKFAWAVRLGGKYWLSERVGLRLQTQWTSFFVMDGGLPAVDVLGLNTGNISFPIAYQFEVGTGLMVKLYPNGK